MLYDSKKTKDESFCVLIQLTTLKLLSHGVGEPGVVRFSLTLCSNKNIANKLKKHFSTLTVKLIF